MISKGVSKRHVLFLCWHLRFLHIKRAYKSGGYRCQLGAIDTTSGHEKAQSVAIRVNKKPALSKDYEFSTASEFR